jgi:hypothetical protein
MLSDTVLGADATAPPVVWAAMRDAIRNAVVECQASVPSDSGSSVGTV